MKLVDMKALKYFYSKLEQIFSGVTVTIKPQTFTDEQKAQARANIGAGSADFTGDYNDLINKPTVAGQSSIDAGKTIKSWSETDGVVAITTQDISITKEQISDFDHKHTVEDITDLDGMNFATEQYVSDAIAELPSPMVFKGSLGADGTITTLPNAVKANTGFTYKVITDNTYSGQKAKAGDMFISDGSKWVYIPSADEEGGVTSVNVSVPTGLSVDGVPITTSGTIAISMEEGYSIPTDAKQGQWDAAYTHSESAHARTDATKVEASETNGNIKIDGVETTVYEHPTQLAKTSDMYKIAVDGTGHVSNAVQATASDLAFDGTVSEVDATNVQDAIDEINTSLADKISVPEMAEGQIATIGQVLAVKSVDESGKPTEWEVVDQSGASDDFLNAPFEAMPSGYVINNGKTYMRYSVSFPKTELKKSMGVIYIQSVDPLSTEMIANIVNATPLNYDSLGLKLTSTTSQASSVGATVLFKNPNENINYKYAYIKPFVIGLDDRVRYLPIIGGEPRITLYDTQQSIGDINSVLEAVL